jgi:hypothetical protein
MPRPINNTPPQGRAAAAATPAAMDVDPALFCQPADSTAPCPAAPTLQEIAHAAAAATLESKAAEISKSLNLSGNHSELEEEIQLTEGSSSIQKKKNKKTKAVVAPSSFKNSRAKVTWHQDRQSKENPMPSDEDLRLEIYHELEELAKPDVHRNCLSGAKGNHTLRLVCANWVLASFKCPKEEEDREVISWVRYASRETNERNANHYIIPFLNVYHGTNDLLTTLRPGHNDILRKHSLCSNGIAMFIQRGAIYWRSIKQQAIEVGPPKVHGNVGKKRGFITDAVIYGTITDFFADLEKLGEMRATRTVKTMKMMERQSTSHKR